MQISFFYLKKFIFASNEDANKFLIEKNSDLHLVKMQISFLFIYLFKKDMITSRFLKQKKILTIKTLKTYSNKENIDNTWYEHLKIKTKQTFIQALSS